MRSRDFFNENRLGASDVLDGLPRNRIRKKADEITRMTGLQRNADFTVGFETTNTRAMPGARVHDNEGSQLRIDFNACGRDNPHEAIVYRTIERTSVDDQLNFVVEHMRSSLRHVFAILVSALTHHIPEQNSALGSVDRVFHRGRKHANRVTVDSKFYLLTTPLRSFYVLRPAGWRIDTTPLTQSHINRL